MSAPRRHPLAKADIESEARRYDGEKPGLGEEFVNEVNSLSGRSVTTVFAPCGKSPSICPAPSDVCFLVGDFDSRPWRWRLFEARRDDRVEIVNIPAGGFGAGEHRSVFLPCLNFDCKPMGNWFLD